MKRIALICIVSLFALMGMAKSLPSTYVEVLYFHGKQRCVTCRAIEKCSKEVVDVDLASYKTSGAVDISTPQGEKLAKKYRVSWSSLYINKWQNGKESRNDFTQPAFKNARNNTAVFKSDLKNKVTQLLK